MVVPLVGDWRKLALRGLAAVVFGILALVWPALTLGVLVLLYLIAAWAPITGVLEVATAIRLRREIRNEWLLGLSGVLSVLLAIVLVLMPGAGARAITWLIGWYAVLSVYCSSRSRGGSGRFRYSWKEASHG
jgi:uncharacterized membrane protein HdeD (DUF308 family)